MDSIKGCIFFLSEVKEYNLFYSFQHQAGSNLKCIFSFLVNTYERRLASHLSD